jgi:hypothetical protein
MCHKCQQQGSALLPELETILNGHQHEFEATGSATTAGITVPSSKSISLYNTDLDAPCFAGNFNFLYNKGSNEARATFNTAISFRKNFSSQDKNNFINNLKQAGDIWDNAAEVQIKDRSGNYSQRIRLRFKVNIVNDRRNANKTTDVHAPGTQAIPVVMGKGREVVSRDLNVFIDSYPNVLAHELGHVWGLNDEYKDIGVWGWLTMKFSPCHVGNSSPFINDTIAIMNQGYTNAGEFRTRYFMHIGRAILKAFWGTNNYVIPVIQNGKVMAKTVQGRIALLKKNIAGDPPYTADRPHNPQFSFIQIAKR